MKKKTAILIAAFTAVLLLSACGSSYEYRFGDVEWYSTYAEEKGTTIKDTYYYSDDWFSGKPEKENTELALASMQLTAAAVTDEENGTGAAFLKNMGFEEVGFSDFKSADPDDCNYTWARKTLPDGSTLVAVAIQSASDDMDIKNKGWKQNFTVNDPDAAETSGEHFAFARAADKVVDDIAALANADKVKFWITGQSRGGAIANILAVRLSEKLGDKNAGIFAYTFEAPATVDEADKGDYKNIHNYVCSDDFVTMIPMWGMTRYGVTHDLKTKETDADLIAELGKMGSEAADLKPRIVTEKVANEIVSNLEKKIPTRADFSKTMTDKWTGADGNQHEITYSYQDSFTDLMDFVFSGDGSESPVSGLASKKDDLSAGVDHLVNGLKLENAGDDPSPEYWEAAENFYDVLSKIADEDSSAALNEEDVYKILRLAAPVLIELPEDQGDPSTELLTDVIAYNKELTYSHMFDTIIARLKILAPMPEK